MGTLIWVQSKLCIHNSVHYYILSDRIPPELSRAGNKSINYFLPSYHFRKYYWNRQYSSKVVAYIVITQSIKGAAHHQDLHNVWGWA